MTEKVGKAKRMRWLAACAAALLTLEAQAVEVTVPGDYPTIQGAIDALAAAPLLGDTVIVEPGTYTEHVQMRSNITVRGRETARTFLRPDGGGTAVSFAAVSNSVIANFTMLGADTGVEIGGSTGIIVASNVFNIGGSGTGVRVTDGSSVDVLNNTFYANGTGGVGKDVIDGTDADLGAYGGDWADVFPFPLKRPTATDTSAAAPPPYNIELGWSPNLSYLVSSGSPPGGYKIYYDSDASGPPYDGADAQDVNGFATPSPIDVRNVTDYVLRNLSPATATPAAPVLQAAAPSNRTVALRWSAVDGASGYRLQYGVVATAEHAIDVGNVTAYTLSGLDNGTTYRFTVSALVQSKYYLAVTAYDRTDAHHESVLSPEASLLLGPQRISMPSNELSAMPEEVAPYPPLPNGHCFIATAAYGYYSAPQVRVLRAFRDKYLLTNAPGRAFVHWYYRNSPPAARYISMHPVWKAVVRVALLPLVALAWLLIHGGTAALGALIVISLATLWLLIMWRRRAWHRSGGAS
ncbi:MAG: fibronectin type III domain-containing protein [Gammaproteobacteria bacterium]